MKGIIYWHPQIYAFFVRLMFKKDYLARYTIIAELIPEGSSVVDVCCGDCKLYEFLKEKNIDYLGLDFNAHFVAAARRRGIRAETFDARNDAIPPSEIIVIQSSLYQFMPSHQEIMKKLFDAAKRYLIISETIKSYGRSPSRVISFLAKRITDPGDGMKPYRFTLEELKKSLAPYRENMAKEYCWQGREYVVMIGKSVKT